MLYGSEDSGFRTIKKWRDKMNKIEKFKNMLNESFELKKIFTSIKKLTSQQNLNKKKI